MNTPYYAFPISEIPASGTIEIDSLIMGYRWGAGARPGDGVTLTYSFGWAGISVYRDGYATPDPDVAWTLSGTAQAAIRQALGTWTAVANIACVEVSDTAAVCGDLRFGASGAPQTAYAIVPVVELPEAGDVWFGDIFYDPGLSWAPGSYAYLTALHEIGHVLGLKHTHEDFEGFPETPLGIDTQLFTVMSYRSTPGAPLEQGYWQSRFAHTPMVNDILAIQYLYGANMSTNAGNTVYSWRPGQAIFETIWDAGGYDTISWANQTSAARIDLRPGSYSELGPAWTAGILLEPRTLGIAHGAWIEAAAGGAGDDVLIGNDLDNSLIGGAGNDTLYGGLGNDLLDGGEGIDTALFGGFSAAYGIVHTAAGEVSVTGPDGTDTLRNIERLSFGDLTLVLNPNAGAGAALGTVFGVTNTRSGEGWLQEASAYAGPVRSLQWQWIGSNDGEAIAGGAGNDFINSLGGMDAIDGGAGDDVLDGGTGSNWLVGGAGRDIFFLDGRSGEPVWSTVADMEVGELVTVWGWRDGLSTLRWEEMNGAVGFRGATAHIDVDADGRIDASLTLSGHAPAALTVTPGVIGDTGYLGVWLLG